MRSRLAMSNPAPPTALDRSGRILGKVGAFLRKGGGFRGVFHRVGQRPRKQRLAPLRYPVAVGPVHAGGVRPNIGASPLVGKGGLQHFPQGLENGDLHACARLGSADGNDTRRSTDFHPNRHTSPMRKPVQAAQTVSG